MGCTVATPCALASRLTTPQAPAPDDSCHRRSDFHTRAIHHDTGPRQLGTTASQLAVRYANTSASVAFSRQFFMCGCRCLRCIPGVTRTTAQAQCPQAMPEAWAAHWSTYAYEDAAYITNRYLQHAGRVVVPASAGAEARGTTVESAARDTGVAGRGGTGSRGGGAGRGGGASSDSAARGSGLGGRDSTDATGLSPSQAVISQDSEHARVPDPSPTPGAPTSADAATTLPGAVPAHGPSAARHVRGDAGGASSAVAPRPRPVTSPADLVARLRGAATAAEATTALQRLVRAVDRGATPPSRAAVISAGLEARRSIGSIGWRQQVADTYGFALHCCD